MMPRPMSSYTEAITAQVAERIARSRYERWDEHAHGPAALSWVAYRHEHPVIAENIYLEDGQADAEALAPFLAQLLNAVADETAGAAVTATAERLLVSGLITAPVHEVMQEIAVRYTAGQYRR